MNSNEGRPARPDTQNDYEATVLDFLDKEMATVQQAQKPNQPSDELDALVADMLNQVLTETDQTQSAYKPLFDEDELFAGLISESQKSADAAVDPPLYSLPSTQSIAQETMLPDANPAASAVPTPGSIFGSSMAVPSQKFAIKAVAAVAGLAVIIGAAAYFFSGHSGKATKSQLAVTQAAKAEVAAVTAPAQSPSKLAAEPASSTTSGKSSAEPAHSAPVKSTVQSSSGKSANSKPEPTPAKVSNDEKPQVAQPAPLAPAPAPASAAAETPSSQPVAENPAPVIPERKPAPSPQVASLVNEPPPSPTSAPVPVASAVSHNLIPAVPLSQASPILSELALRSRASGQVVMELQIDDQGKVIKATAVSGPAIFYTAAVTAAMKWRYKPASISGANVPSQSRVTMSFNLKK
jgi:TonB family protein